VFFNYMGEVKEGVYVGCWGVGIETQYIPKSFKLHGLSK
jgi:hypothetical protein